MAWIEQVGKRAWRVRYRNGDGSTLSLSGFRSRTAAEDFASDMETERRRGVWLDPSGRRHLSWTGPTAGSRRWMWSRVPRRTTAAACAITSCRSGATRAEGDHRVGGDELVQTAPPALRGVDGGGHPDGVSDADGRRGR